MNYQEIKQFLHSKSALFHFTKYQTATEHILCDMQLRLSPRKNMNDPFEKFVPPISNSLWHYSEVESDMLEKRKKPKVEKIENDIEDILKDAKQVSFCMNKKKINHADDNGYTRLRMWDQYADNYKGVCLIFDKKKYIKKIHQKNNLKRRKIAYKRIEWFKNDNINIDYNDLDEYGKKYEKYLYKNVYNRLFYKHIDYRDENEYRIVLLSENEYEYINIKESIVAIMIIPEYLKTCQVKNLYEISEKKSIPLLYLSIIGSFEFVIAQDFISTKTIDGCFHP